jgi:hypothetical protein
MLEIKGMKTNFWFFALSPVSVRSLSRGHRCDDSQVLVHSQQVTRRKHLGCLLDEHSANRLARNPQFDPARWKWSLERAPLSADEQSNNTQTWILQPSQHLPSSAGQLLAALLRLALLAESANSDALRIFSDACRDELRKFRVI